MIKAWVDEFGGGIDLQWVGWLLSAEKKYVMAAPVRAPKKKEDTETGTEKKFLSLFKSMKGRRPHTMKRSQDLKISFHYMKIFKVNIYSFKRNVSNYNATTLL